MDRSRVKAASLLAGTVGLLVGGCSSPTRLTAASPTTTQARVPVNPTGAPLLLALRHSATVVEGGVPAAEITVDGVAASSAPAPATGRAPNFGYFVTVSVTVHAIGQSQVDIAPTDFWVQESDGVRRQTTTGNAPFAAGPGALTVVHLDPGQTASGTITVDATGTHGWVVYAPAGAPQDSWPF